MKTKISRIDRKSYLFRFALVSIINSFLFLTADEFPSIFIYFALNFYVVLLGIGRMHDVNKSGWYYFIPFYNLYLIFKKGDEGTNNYGANVIKIDEVESHYLYPMIMSILFSLFFASIVYFILTQTKILSVFSNEESLKSIFFILSIIIVSTFCLNSFFTNKSNT